MSMWIGNRVEYYEYELLTLQSGVYKHSRYITNYVEEASIKSDFTRDIIGTASFKLNETDLINAGITINYFTDLIRPWYCLVYEGTVYKYPLGTYFLTMPSKKSDGRFIERNVDAFDMLLALEQDKMTTSTTIADGSTVTDEIETLLDGVGSWVKYAIEPSDETLNEDMSYVVGRSRLFIVNSLLNVINYNPLFCTGNGVYKGIPWSATPNTTYEFIDNDESLYESGIESDIDYSDIYNKVIIVTNQLEADTEPIVSSATMEDYDLDNHPFSYTSIGRYLTKKFESEASSQGYTDLRAKRELYKMLQLEESVNYKHGFITSRADGLPWYGDCYKFKNTLLNLNATYKIESHSMNLKTGSSVNSIIKKYTI